MPAAAPRPSSRRWTALLVVWLTAAVAVGAAELLFRLPVPPPVVILTLTAAVLLLLWRSAPARTWALSGGAAPLVALHLTRFVGFAFLLLAARGELSPEWAVPAGWGDVLVAAGAALVLAFALPARTAGRRRALLAWNVLGLLDITLVVAGAARMVLADPAALAPMGRLPLSLLPTFLVPLIFVSHALIFVLLRRAGEPAAPRRGTGSLAGAAS